LCSWTLLPELKLMMTMMMMMMMKVSFFKDFGLQVLKILRSPKS